MFIFIIRTYLRRCAPPCHRYLFSVVLKPQKMFLGLHNIGQLDNVIHFVPVWQGLWKSIQTNKHPSLTFLTLMTSRYCNDVPYWLIALLGLILAMVFYFACRPLFRRLSTSKLCFSARRPFTNTERCKLISEPS
jgi:hypothetical protein